MPQSEQVPLAVQMTSVKSSVIAEIGWQGDRLYIKMRNGSQYIYDQVPEHVYQDGLTWSSIGVWYNTVIKGKY